MTGISQTAQEDTVTNQPSAQKSVSGAALVVLADPATGDPQTGGITIAAGQTLAVTGVTAPNDTVDSFSFTAVYNAADPATYLRVPLNGAASVRLQLLSAGSGGGVTVVGALSNGTMTSSIEGRPVRLGAEGQNGPGISLLSGAGLYDFPGAQLQYLEVRPSVYGSGTINGYVATNASPACVGVFGKVDISGLEDSQAFAIRKLACATNALEVITAKTSGKTKVTEITLQAFGTVAAYVDYEIVKNTTLSTGGSPTTVTGSAKFDTADAFQSDTCTVQKYTVDPAAGAGTRTVLHTGTLYVAATGTPTTNPPETIRFGALPQKAAMIRGAAEQISVSFLGASPAGMLLNANIRVTNGAQ
jgi:hypothetical protein